MQIKRESVLINPNDIVEKGQIHPHQLTKNQENKLSELIQHFSKKDRIKARYGISKSALELEIDYLESVYNNLEDKKNLDISIYYKNYSTSDNERRTRPYPVQTDKNHDLAFKRIIKSIKKKKRNDFIIFAIDSAMAKHITSLTRSQNLIKVEKSP